jgi:hypothetical protein
MQDEDEDSVMTNPPTGKTHFFDNPRNVKRVIRSLYAVCALVFSLDIISLVISAMGGHELRHAETSWEGVPGFYAIYGFVACVILVLAATQLRKILMRKEDYYDR